LLASPSIATLAEHHTRSRYRSRGARRPATVNRGARQKHPLQRVVVPSFDGLIEKLCAARGWHRKAA
jgi:hypothetical protein